MPTRRPVLIDTDIGLCNDDCFALLLMLASPEVEVIGVTTVAGNLQVEQSAVIAKSVLEFLGECDVPVCAGRKRPLKHRYGEFERRAYGRWGETNRVTSIIEGLPTGSLSEMPASDFIVENVKRYRTKIDLLMIGPLTNVARAILNSPEIVPMVHEAVVMGGAFREFGNGEGNITSEAEFNFWVDPDAASIVLASGIKSIIIPLNVSRDVAFGASAFEAMRSRRSGAAQLLKMFLEEFFACYPSALIQLHDVVAAGFLLWKELFDVTAESVGIITRHGSSYGRSYLKGTHLANASVIGVARRVRSQQLFGLATKRLFFGNAETCCR